VAFFDLGSGSWWKWELVEVTSEGADAYLNGRAIGDVVCERSDLDVE
jgi:hypothetical protein